jgi:uncharacterized protein
MKFYLSRFFLGSLFLFVSACSTSSLITPYPQQITPVINDLKVNMAKDGGDLFTLDAHSADSVLYQMERGRIQQIQSKLDGSVEKYASALEDVKAYEEKARISASDAGAQVAALLVNDNVIPYKGEPYEQIMLHSLQAVNYLLKNDPENAAPEARLAGDRQREALLEREKELENLKGEAKKNNVDPNVGDSVLKQYAGLDEVAGKVKNSFQNAYAFYIAALVYEAHKEPDQAYKDYQNALEIFPNNSYLQRDTVRLAKKLGMSSDLNGYAKRFPKAYQEGSALAKPPADKGELIVLMEDDFIPQKQQIKIPIPVNLSGGFTAVAFPTYSVKWLAPAPLTVSEGTGKTLGKTETLCYLDSLALRALKERIPALVIRQILRSAVKGTGAYFASEKLGWGAGLATSVINYASENADLRGWYTLPQNAQVMRVWLPAGKHTLNLKHDRSGASAKVEVEVPKGGQAIVRAVRAGGTLYTQAAKL